MPSSALRPAGFQAEISPSLIAFNPFPSVRSWSLSMRGQSTWERMFFSILPEFLDALARETLAKGIKPELEVFEAGMVYTCIRYLEKGLLKSPLHFQFVLGTQGGMPATAKSLLHLTEIIPQDSTWSVIGIGAGQLPMAMMGMVMGGHVRVGLEDNIYYSKGVLAKSNAELVERVVRIAKEFGREVATPSEARKILNLPFRA